MQRKGMTRHGKVRSRYRSGSRYAKERKGNVRHGNAR